MSRSLMTLAVRTVAMTVGWWVLTEADPKTAGYGVIAVPVAVLVSHYLAPLPQRQSPRLPGRVAATLRLVGWFLGQVVSGGVDVALRAVRRPVRIDPVQLRLPVLLPDGPARQVALGLVNLMPGSLVQQEDPDEITVHGLSAELPIERQWQQLQSRVASAFGLRLSSSADDGG